MILIPWIERVGHVFVADNTHNCVLSCDSPVSLAAFVSEKFNPKKHQAALLIKYKESKWVLFIMGHGDIPLENVYDPSNGKLLLEYAKENNFGALARID